MRQSQTFSTYLKTEFPRPLLNPLKKLMDFCFGTPPIYNDAIMPLTTYFFDYFLLKYQIFKFLYN